MTDFSSPDARQNMAAAGHLFGMKGRTVMVTGASSGIGRHAAQLLSAQGAAVALAARRVETTRRLAGEIVEQGGNAVGVYMDIADPESLRRAFDEAETQLAAPIDVLVNNAGVIYAAKFLEQRVEEMARVIDVNFKGSFMVAQEAARRMAARGQGCIVNVGSTAGLRAGSYMASYAASKAALLQLNQVMALELAGKGIRVNALCPGNIDTDMQAPLAEKGFSEAMRKRTPMRRFGTVSDLNGALLLLCSDASAYMTGSIVVVDGGQTLSWM
ncbi:SDR family NAD(P)-dependent oxidoreductase [Ottowia sp. VDI28]|uniref:SDR family NAD(P)-dependent oxidoreductase n=1 Tax=Ottowia sp. VDI28 TaxID=3133968 RepID=UPI003C2ACF36